MLFVNQFKINSLATEICRKIQEKGFQAFLVGGCVRDLLLNQSPKDWDICSSATPEQVKEIFSKTYDTGLAHGTVTVSEGNPPELFEVTTFRTEGEYLDGRRPSSVAFVTDVTSDLSRRDLTINAIAYDPINCRMVDPFNGRLDLEDGVIKAVGNAEDRFQEDGLRIMRVARFAARFNYQVNRDTLEGMMHNLDTLKKVSKERVSDELRKTLMAQNPRAGIWILFLSGALDAVLPRWSAISNILSGVASETYAGELETRLATFYNRVAAEEVVAELTELKFSNKEIKRVTFLLSLLEEYRMVDSQELYSRLMARMKNQSHDTFDYVLSQFKLLLQSIGETSRVLEKYSEVFITARKDLQINGNDLMQLSVPAGPKLKFILDELYDKVLLDPSLNDSEILKSLVENYLEKVLA